MSWTTRISGLPTQTSLSFGDTYVGGLFTLSTNTGSREWDVTGSGNNAPVAYETLASIGADITKVLRITARYSARAGFSGEDLGAGVVLYGPNRDDACLVRSLETDPNTSPGAGEVTAKAWENDVLNTIATTSLPTTAAPPNQFRIYWNPTGSAFVIPDAGFGSWSVAAGYVSYWYSDDDGTTWTRLGDGAIVAGVVPDKVGIYTNCGTPVGGTPTVTFSAFEVVEDDNEPPTLQNLDPDNLDTGVLVGANLTIEIVDNGTVDDSTVDIQLKRGAAAWESVWTGDAQQSGYAVTKSMITGGYRYVVNPDVDLPYEETIQVRVQADDMAGTPNSMDETYSFETQLDLQPPTLQNLSPDAEDENISVSSNVYLEVVDLAQVGVDDATVEIYLRRGPDAAWEPVWLSDAAQSGYSVTKGSVTDGFSYDINPDTDFPQTEWIEVRVVADDVAITPNEMDETYRFLTEGPITLKNQDPAPQEEDVDNATRPIEFDILDPGANIDLNSVKIWIEGELIWESDASGEFWYVTKTAIGTAGYHYSIVLEERLEWDKWIRVRVQADSAVSGSIDETYFFKTRDRVWILKDDFDDGTPWPYLSGNGSVTESGGEQVYSASGGSTDWYSSVARQGKLPYISFTPPTYGILYVEAEIKQIVEAGNAHHLFAIYQDNSNFLWIYGEVNTPTAFNIASYNVIGNSWAYQTAYSGNPLTFPIKIRFKWDIGKKILERQVFDGGVWVTFDTLAMTITPTKVVHYGKCWSGGSITTRHEYVYIYWEPTTELSMEKEQSALEDAYQLPTLSGPRKHQSPEGMNQGTGFRLPGVPDQPVRNAGHRGPFDYAGIEDGPAEFKTAGGPSKWNIPPGYGPGAGVRVPGAVDQPITNPGQRGPFDYSGYEDAVYHYLSSEPEIRPDTYDTEGRPQLTGEVFWGAYYYNAEGPDEYWNTPTLNFFTGYGKDGKHYTNGVQDAGPVWAPWAIETPSDHRSLRTDFPNKALIVWGQIDVVIFDLDSFDGTPNTLKVWMRFQVDNSTTNFKALGRVAYSVRDVKMANGVLVAGTQHNGTENGGLFCIDFKSNDDNVFPLMRADGRWKAKPGYTIANRNDTGGVYVSVNSNLHVDSEYVYRVDCWAPAPDGLWVAHVGEDTEDPQITYLAQNEYQWRGRNYGDDRGTGNLNDYWYKSIIFDEDRWLWYSVENKLYRCVFNYESGNVNTVSFSPLIKRVTLPENIYFLAAAKDNIYAVTQGGIWQIHRGTLEYHIAYTVESNSAGGGKDNNPPDGALIKGGRLSTRIQKIYGVSLSLSAYLGVSVHYAYGGAATILRLYDDVVLASFEAPALAEDGCYFTLPVPV